MPNYVRNEIKMKGIADMPIFLDEGDEYGEHALDFNKIVPMPEELNVAAGGSTSEAIAWYLTGHGTADPARYGELAQSVPSTDRCFGMCNLAGKGNMARLLKAVKDFIGDSRKRDDSLYEKGRRYAENLRKYGFAHWYDWCCANWGTKWNAMDSYAVDDDTVLFSTAWDPALPIAEKLSEMYPGTEVVLRWADENIGCYTGCATFLNGKGRFKRPEDESSEALAIFVDLWGGDYDCLGQDGNGDWHVVLDDEEAC